MKHCRFAGTSELIFFQPQAIRETKIWQGFLTKIRLETPRVRLAHDLKNTSVNISLNHF